METYDQGLSTYRLGAFSFCLKENEVVVITNVMLCQWRILVSTINTRS